MGLLCCNINSLDHLWTLSLSNAELGFQVRPFLGTASGQSMCMERCLVNTYFRGNLSHTYIIVQLRLCLVYDKY